MGTGDHRLDGRRCCTGRSRPTRRRLGPHRGGRRRGRPDVGHERAQRSVREPRVRRLDLYLRPVDGDAEAVYWLADAGASAGGSSPTTSAGLGLDDGRRPSAATAPSRPAGRWSSPRACGRHDDGDRAHRDAGSKATTEAEVDLDKTAGSPGRPGRRIGCPPDAGRPADRRSPRTSASTVVDRRPAPLRRPRTSDQPRRDLTETLPRHRGRRVYLYVERGYQRRDEIVILLLVLVTLGGVLMLGGTLTATFLALSDARPDLATLSAVGAAPRSRRRVAASYALVVGFVGAVLGAAVGFIPGVAIALSADGSPQGLYSSSTTGRSPARRRALPRHPVAADRRVSCWRCRC